ncbi:MAG: DUF523 domain-containing protein [Aureispira sp.]|nr:DUF523 domain-containing protein [Aureispira sp.]
MSPQHLPTHTYFEQLPQPSQEIPLRILFSGCLAGNVCTYENTELAYDHIYQIVKHPKVKAFPFCPEHYAKGTPRLLSDIHGGNGFDVLDGKAKVLATNGEDWTRAMLDAAQKMLEVAQQQQVQLAIMLDISGACGTQTIYLGDRTIAPQNYQKGPGVCAALLIRKGIKVISQRDYATLELLTQKLNPAHKINTTAIDHHQTAWYLDYFKD